MPEPNHLRQGRTGSARFGKLLEPGFIGKVRTRNRIYKSGAGMMCFHEGM